MSNKNKPVEKVTEPGLSFSSKTNACKNFHTQSCGRGGCESQAGRGSYSGGKVLNNIPASGINNITRFNLGNHSKDTYFNCNKVGHWSNKYLEPTPEI